MGGYITIKERQIPERRLWAVLGIVGLLVPVSVAPIALITLWFAPLAVALLAGLVWIGMGMRGKASAARSRWWSFATWAVATGIWQGTLIGLAFPPGADLPTGPSAVVIYAVLFVLLFGGSVAIALGSFEIGRRFLWRVAQAA